MYNRPGRINRALKLVILTGIKILNPGITTLLP
jgi:hypothetical protein